jgi:hypothetical protein
VVYYYLKLARAFYWTPNEIDDMELDMFWDLIIVGAKEPQEGDQPMGYIDQVL